MLGLASLGGVSQSAPGRNLYCSAHQFLCYYRAVERANNQAGFFDRVALSLVLTNGSCQKEKPASL